ncbi:MAG: hypothetical protein ACTHK7_15515 [Aureliella sp.]
MSNSYPAFFLPMNDGKHQFAALQHLVQWRDGVEMDEDGCLIFHNSPCTVDGWESDSADPNVLLPVADECLDRIHAMYIEDGKPRLETFCMRAGCEHFKGVVNMQTCSQCPLRRGRE